MIHQWILGELSGSQPHGSSWEPLEMDEGMSSSQHVTDYQRVNQLPGLVMTNSSPW